MGRVTGSRFELGYGKTAGVRELGQVHYMKTPTDMVVVVVTLSWIVQWILRATLLFQIRVACHGASGGLCCMGELLKTVILLLEEVI